MIKDSAIILSGGMDSTTMLYEYQHRIALAVTFDYGSNHNAREIECAKKHCFKLNIEHIVISLDFMAKYFKSSLLSGADDIPEGSYNDDNMKSTVVPFRNGIMLSIACGLAESRHLTTVMMANHSGDHTVYPDCRPEFVDSMSEAISNGTYDNIRILAPYTHLTKGDIATIGKRIGIDYATTYSCYKGGELHCGVCGTCVERKEALAFANINDTTPYLK